jgi:hypothetical protein
VLGISYNKAIFFFFWRFSVLVLHRSARRSPVMSFVEPSRWWSGVCGRSGETFFNKWCFSSAAGSCCYCSPLRPAMVAWRGAGCRRCSATMEEIGEYQSSRIHV